MSREQKAAASERDIRSRAYEIYLERGGNSGRALEDWLQAKAELERPAEKGRASSKEK
jgi:hypothetical protein